MIKEMVKTYLPEYDDKDRFSPHKLRATCATRILTQTGDIQLASTQLNHKGIAVTAAFYAELQKEQQKERVKNLDINKW
jgi:integrase